MVSVKKSETKNDKVEFRKRRSDTFSKRNNYEGLFILGVLESAAKDKKRRRTMHIKKEINKNLKDEDFLKECLKKESLMEKEKCIIKAKQ